MTIILGLAGLRRAGKSTAADHLVAAHGFVRLHPFDGGKAAARGYYMHIGIDEDTAWRMTDGDLKDTPCELLPGNATSRDFLEPFGKFMGVSMGADWTIGRELLRHQALGHERIIAESVVYEDQVVRGMGGVIWRLNKEGREPVHGLDTDAYTMAMACDLEIDNDGSKEELYEKLDISLEQHLARLADAEAEFAIA